MRMIVHLGLACNKRKSNFEHFCAGLFYLRVHALALGGCGIIEVIQMSTFLAPEGVGSWRSL